MENFIADKSYEKDSDNTKRIKQLKILLRRVISEQLSENQRKIIYLYYYGNMNMPQIAVELNINKSTVSRTIALAKKTLYSYLQYYYTR